MPAGIPLSNLSGLHWGCVGATTQAQARTLAGAELSFRWRPWHQDRGLELAVTRGDITQVRVDAIVSSSNSALVFDSGVNAAILAKGGREIAEDCCACTYAYGPLPVSHVVTTRAGRLPCHYVIHAVGPSLRGFQSPQPTLEHAELLRATIRNVLCEADRLKLTSIAIPAISSGNAGYPKSLATMEIVNECVRYVHEYSTWTTIKTILFADCDTPTFRCFVCALNSVAALNGSNHTIEFAVGSLTNFHRDSAPVPTLPQQAIFELLSPQDPEYQRILAELRPRGRPRIVSVRRVRVSACFSEYEKTRRSLQGTPVVEVEPLYHGTPNRWRATAIAMNGFDLRFCVNGRSWGDGVYATTEVNMAIPFAKVRGSLLRLRGLVSHTTVDRKPVYVFQNPAAVCSMTIIDYAAEDERDRRVAQGR